MIHPKRKDENGNDIEILKEDYYKECLDHIRDKVLFTPEDENGERIMEKFVTILQEETSSQLNKTKDDLTVNFNLYDPWNFYKTLQIVVKEQN